MKATDTRFATESGHWINCKANTLNSRSLFHPKLSHGGLRGVAQDRQHLTEEEKLLDQHRLRLIPALFTVDILETKLLNQYPVSQSQSHSESHNQKRKQSKLLLPKPHSSTVAFPPYRR